MKKENLEDIGFFDLKYKGSGPIINTRKIVFYQDVYAFIN